MTVGHRIPGPLWGVMDMDLTNQITRAGLTCQLKYIRPITLEQNYVMGRGLNTRDGMARAN